MGRSQKRKGYRGEYLIVKKLQALGIDAQRVPLSGATDFAKGDILIKTASGDMVGEVKWRGRGFKTLYKFLEGKDVLFIKADRKEPLVVMSLEVFTRLLRGQGDAGDI